LSGPVKVVAVGNLNTATDNYNLFFGFDLLALGWLLGSKKCLRKVIWQEQSLGTVE